MVWAAAAGVLLAGVVVSGYFLLNSSALRRFVLGKIVRQVNETTGAGLQVQKLDFELRTLTARFYGVTLHGAEGASEKPLLAMDKLTLSLRIDPLVRRKVSLSQLLIDHPVVHLAVNQDGKTNMPEPAPKKTESNGPSVFDLAVQHTVINDGEIYFNDRKTPFAADIRSLQTEVHFDYPTSGYLGTISYGNGDLQYDHYTPLPHELNVKFTATPSSFSLDALTLKVASSNISAQAKMANYSRPQVEGSYRVDIHPQDFAQMSPGAQVVGDVLLSGPIRYQNAASGQFMDGLQLGGHLHSEGLKATSTDGEIAVRQLDANYQLAKGILHASDLSAELLNGRLEGSLVVRNLETTPQAEVSASIHRISIAAMRQVMKNPQVRNLPLTGTVDGDAEISWTGSPQHLRVASNLQVHGEAVGEAGGPRQSVPVEGAVHLHYDGRNNSLALNQTSLQAAATSVVLQGEVSDRSSLQVHANARDLHQLALLVPVFSGGDSATAKALVDVSGSATLNAVLQGSIRSPRISGDLNAQNLETRGSQWKTAAVEFDVSPSEFKLKNISLINAGRGRVSGNAHVVLKNWSYTAPNPMAANLSVRQMSISDLQHLAGEDYPISGTLAANISLSGSQLNPLGQGTVQITQARVYDEPVESISLKLDGSNATLHSVANVGLPAGKADADLQYVPKTKAYTFRLNAPAMSLQNLEHVQGRNLDLTGTVNISARGQGTVDNPQMTAEVQLPELRVRQTSLTGIKAQLNVANQRANLVLSSDVNQAHIESHGSVSLARGHYAEVSIDTNQVPLDPFLVMYAPNLPQGFQGETELHATLKGPLDDKSQVEAHVTVSTLRASYQKLEIEGAGPIRADYSHSVVTFQPAEIHGTGTSLHWQGTVPLTGSAPMSLTANGSVDVRVLEIIRPDIKSAGSLALDIRSSGSAKNPTVAGKIHLQDVALATADAPLGVEKLTGDLGVDSKEVQINGLTCQVGGGQVTVGGSIGLRPELRFNVALQGQSVRLRYPEGVRTVLDSNVSFTGTKEASALTGRVLINSLSFTPDFDLNEFVNQFSGTSVPPTGQGFADNVKLQVGVQSTQNLNAVSSQVSLGGAANLQLIGTAANPVIVGRADVTSGELFFRNNRYKVERGLVTFDNPIQTEPFVNLAVTTTIQQYNLTITLKGPIDKLETTYVSDPPLATADVINLIASGQTTQEASASNAGPDSILAGQVASQVTGNIQKLAGISSLQIDPLIGGNNQNPSARVAVQQRVTRNLLFTFSTDVTQPGTEVIQGDYQINRRWSVSVARDQQGGVSVDGQYHTKF